MSLPSAPSTSTNAFALEGQKVVKRTDSTSITFAKKQEKERKCVREVEERLTFVHEILIRDTAQNRHLLADQAYPPRSQARALQRLLLPLSLPLFLPPVLPLLLPLALR